MNVAVTSLAASIVTTQSSVPEQPSPRHPVNVEPLFAVPVNVTTVPSAYGAVHDAPQSIPAGALVTEPLPVPSFTTTSVKWSGLSVLDVTLGSVNIILGRKYPPVCIIGKKILCTAASAVNVAVTFLAASMVTTQSSVPEQPSPLQPVNVEPLSAVPDNVTSVPSAYGAEHDAPQSMPAGVLVTEPLPVPSFTTVR